MQSNRKNITSGAVWEDIVGYSRAVQVGNTIEIAGTTAVDSNNAIVGRGDAFTQTTFIIEKAKKVLEDLGYGLEHVVRTRIYCTNIASWEAIGRAHGKFFKNIKPAATMVEVSGLVNPDLLVEIEFSCIV